MMLKPNTVRIKIFCEEIAYLPPKSWKIDYLPLAQKRSRVERANMLALLLLSTSLSCQRREEIRQSLTTPGAARIGSLAGRHAELETVKFYAILE